MITMVQKNEILIRYFKKGQSQRKISRELHISRQTVKNYIIKYLKTRTDELVDLNTQLSQKHHYDTSTRRRRKFTNEIQTIVDKFLSENEQKKLKGMHKQLMKAEDIHKYLTSNNYDIGYTTICNYIRDYKKGKSSVFIKQDYLPGGVCEFDWGEVKLVINGTVKKLNMAVFTSAYSNFRYAKLFVKQDSLAFSQSHVDFFNSINGVYQEMVYDNMRTAVKKFVGLKEKEPTDLLVNMSNYYLFSYRFCNVRKGNEKGHVERSVEYIRRKSFSLTTEFNNIDEANNHLLNECEKLNNTKQQLSGKTANDMFEVEKESLAVNKSSFDCSLISTGKVDSYSTITYMQNHYSVPEELTGKILDLKITTDKISIYYKNKLKCEHTRRYGLHEWSLNLDHYLVTLSKKPGALYSSKALKMYNPEIKKVYDKYFKNNAKDFIRLLQYKNNVKINTENFVEAINKVTETTVNDVSYDKIVSILSNKQIELLKESQSTSSEIEEHANEQLRELSKLTTAV